MQTYFFIKSNSEKFLAITKHIISKFIDFLYKENKQNPEYIVLSSKINILITFGCQ